MRYESLAARIIANSVVSDSHFHADGTACWEWLGAFNSRGYPRLTVRKPQGPRAVFVHRLVCEVFKGIDMRYQEVARHLCNWTPCVNPGHLDPGTQSENMLQCIEDGRHNSFKAREPGCD